MFKLIFTLFAYIFNHQELKISSPKDILQNDPKRYLAGWDLRKCTKVDKTKIHQLIAIHFRRKTYMRLKSPQVSIPDKEDLAYSVLNELKKDGFDIHAGGLHNDWNMEF